MSHREDLEFQLQKECLAIQEVNENTYITAKERQERINTNKFQRSNDSLGERTWY